MIPIEIDVGGLAEEFSLSNNQIDELVSYVVMGVTSVAYEQWKRIASRELKGSREIYVNSLILGDEGPYIGFVKLSAGKSPLPNMLENGIPAFDMKDGFSHGPKVKVKKGGGWYTTIPFRFVTSNSLGESSIFVAKMPKEVENEAKKLLPKEKLKINNIPEQYRVPKVGKEKIGENKVFEKYKQKTSIFEGLTKTKLQGSSKHTQYINFRRVSDTSNPESWIHPGFTALNLKDKTLNSLDLFNQIDRLIDQFLEAKGFGK